MIFLKNLYFVFGALTAKAYAFKSRSWELRTLQSVDALDSLNANITVLLRNNIIQRILPRLNDSINESWISDRVRFSFDGLLTQRLTYPFILYKNQFIPTRWLYAYIAICAEYFFIIFLKKFGKFTNRFFGVLGSFATMNTAVLLKTFLNKLGSSNLYLNPKFSRIFSDARNNFIMPTVALPKQAASNVLYILVGVDLRVEHPVLNIRLKQQIINGNVWSFGTSDFSKSSVRQVGNSSSTFLKFLEGNLGICADVFNFSSIYILVGTSIVSRKDFYFTWELIRKFSDYISINSSTIVLPSILARFSSEVSALDIGSNVGQYSFNSYIYSNNASTRMSSLKKSGYMFFSVGYSSMFKQKEKLAKLSNYYHVLQDSCNIYVGSHNHKYLKNFNIILPAGTLYEQAGFYTNIFGVRQFAPHVISTLFPTDVSIFNKIHYYFYALRYNSLYLDGRFWYYYNKYTSIFPDRASLALDFDMDKFSFSRKIWSAFVPMKHFAIGYIFKSIFTNLSINGYIFDAFTANSITLQSTFFKFSQKTNFNFNKYFE